jgi:NAD(P)-dependent dehydrogenase (short-subunit alcohol dehydrogenase family)
VNSLLPGPTATEGIVTYIDGIVAQGGYVARKTVSPRTFFAKPFACVLSSQLRVPLAYLSPSRRGSSREEATHNYFKTREPTSLLQRFLTVDEVANVATFLASDLSSGINGAAQLVEGGIIRHV